MFTRTKTTLGVLSLAALVGCAGGTKYLGAPSSSKQAYLNSPRGSYELCLMASYIEYRKKGFIHNQAFENSIFNCKEYREKLLKSGNFEWNVKHVEAHIEAKLSRRLSNSDRK